MLESIDERENKVISALLRCPELPLSGSYV